MRTVDVDATLDAGRFSAYQKRLIAGAALAIVLDGVDNQLLPNAVPSLMREWALPRAAFATASAAGPFGMMVGGIAGGLLGDRVGRRTALLASVLSFAVLTLAIAFVDGLGMLTVLRFLAGIGLGGAMPTAAALVSEYAPGRQRPLAITLTILCVPIGGVIAGLLAGQIVPAYGWRVLFVVGGSAPIVLAGVLAAVMPESPRYLARRPARWAELRAVLRRMGHAVGDDARFVDSAASGRSVSRGAIVELFSPALRRDTVGLMGAFGACLLAIYVGFLWIPAMLADPAVGFSQPAASYALSLFNVGGVVGALVGALVMQRLGSRASLLALAALGGLSALVMAALPLDPAAALPAMMLFATTGALLNAVQIGMYALAVHVYPTAIRSTGVGATVAVGRIGNVLASYVGSWALGLGGPPAYFTTWAAAMAIVFISLALVRRHIPRVSAAHPVAV